jgi:hypothetical protein
MDRSLEKSSLYISGDERYVKMKYLDSKAKALKGLKSRLNVKKNESI